MRNGATENRENLFFGEFLSYKLAQNDVQWQSEAKKWLKG